MKKKNPAGKAEMENKMYWNESWKKKEVMEVLWEFKYRRMP